MHLMFASLLFLFWVCVEADLQISLLQLLFNLQPLLLEDLKRQLKE